MRIAFITAGAAGMYCGTCMHDAALAAAVIRAGHEMALVPTYTPIRTDDEDVSVDRVFYGAINVYLEQRSAIFRHTPWLVDRMLNSRALLDWASGHGTSVDASQLGEMTLSVLQGRDGNQKKEMDKLIEWLRDDYKPDVVHFTNSMFLGLARPVREALQVPVLFSLQGEDLFLEQLAEPHYSQVRALLSEKSSEADAFVAQSEYYLDFMADYLGASRERMHRIPLGLKLQGHGIEHPTLPESPFTIGYLARICPEKGLHLLVAAVHELAERVGKNRLRLRVAGYLGDKDRAYKEGIRAQIREWDLDDVFEDLGEIDRNEKIAFLNSIHVLSVPTTYREPKGLFVLESLANRVPVVLPEHGAFPELVAETGGGLLVEPDDPGALADGLQALMDDPSRRREMGRSGRRAVEEKYTDDLAAERTLNLYRQCVDNGVAD